MLIGIKHPLVPPSGSTINARKPRGVKAKGCQSKAMSKQNDARAHGCQSKGMSKQRDARAKGCQSKGMPKPRDVKAKGCTKCCVLQENHASQKMDGEACPADGCETRSFTPGSWADRPRSGTAVSGVVLLNLNFQKFEGRLARKLRFYIFLFQFLTEVSHESFVFTLSTFTF